MQRANRTVSNKSLIPPFLIAINLWRQIKCSEEKCDKVCAVLPNCLRKERITLQEPLFYLAIIALKSLELVMETWTTAVSQHDVRSTVLLRWLSVAFDVAVVKLRCVTFTCLIQSGDQWDIPAVDPVKLVLNFFVGWSVGNSSTLWLFKSKNLI